MSKRHGDNHHQQGGLGGRPRLSIPEGTTEMELSDEAKAKVRELDQAVAQAKFKLGDLEFRFAQMSKERDLLIETIEKAQGAFTKGVLVMAQTLGIDVADSTKGKWNFDVPTMKFTKTG